MPEINAVLGQAGTGKTTWLLRKANECAPGLITAEHQRMLVITRMHGARRRLEAKLPESCPSLAYSVATIDGFALSILNRWRTALGHNRPISAVPEDSNFVHTPFGIEAGFGPILADAARLLQSPTVQHIIGASYPLILIDEFQDCHGPLLDFVVALSKSSCLLLAADDFQLLDSDVMGCPAIDWVRTLHASGSAVVEELNVCHRTSVSALLEAARCLRENARSSSQTIPVICCPQHGPAAWKIIERLVLCPPATRWTGTCALICPSHDPFIHKVLESCADQLRKKSGLSIRWHEEFSAEEEKLRIRTELGLTTTSPGSDGTWQGPPSMPDGLGMHVIHRTQRFSKLRGLGHIPQRLVARYVDTVIHERRAYYVRLPKRTVATVHGAKNREFDNVFILWTYKVPPDQSVQRRLLYNAVTRSKKNCMLLVLGDTKRAREDPVLSLLGSPEPAFPANRRPRNSSARRARRQGAR